MNNITKLIYTILFLLLGIPASAQTCTTTLSEGASVDTALSTAAAGDVICLNTGNYGSQTIQTRRPSSNITIRSTTGRGAAFSSIRIRNSSNLIFKSLTTNGFWVDPAGGSAPVNSDLTFADNRIQADGVTAGDGRFGLDGGMRMLIYGNLFTGGYRSDGFEGQLYVTNQSSVASSNVIAHNEFDGTGACGDAIQFTNNGSATVGPGNYFHDWIQGGCGSGPGFGAHADAIQSVGQDNVFVYGNLFRNNTINLGYYDGGSNLSFTHNIVDGDASGAASFQVGGVQGMDFSHNTIKDVDGSFGSKAANPPNSGWVIENNVFWNSTFTTAASDQDDGCGSGCLFRYNVINNSTFSIVATPTNTVTGAPDFVGGDAPADWFGWKLCAAAGGNCAGASPGRNAGNDGKDMGTLYYKRSPVTGVN